MSTVPIDRETLCKSAPNAEKLVEIYEAWSRITYLSAPKDGEIIQDIVMLEDTTITQHAPLMGVKPGKEKAEPVWKMASQLRHIFKVISLTRHGMLTAVHPKGTAMALLFTAHVKAKLIPCYAMKEDILFIFEVADDKEGTLQISSIHEHRAKAPEGALVILEETYYWPGDAKFVNYSFSPDDA
jgi:hypothetical protein